MGRRLGLLIGINQYQHSAFLPLQFAENDAKALAQWLVNSRGGNWIPSDVQLVLGSQATSELAEALIKQVCVNVAEPGDLVFIYFGGHAFVDEASGDGYLALANTRYEQPATGMHLMSLVRHALVRSRYSIASKQVPSGVCDELPRSISNRCLAQPCKAACNKHRAACCIVRAGGMNMRLRQAKKN